MRFNLALKYLTLDIEMHWLSNQTLNFRKNKTRFISIYDSRIHNYKIRVLLFNLIVNLFMAISTYSIGIGKVTSIGEPTGQMIVRTASRDVVDNQCTGCTSVI